LAKLKSGSVVGEMAFFNGGFRAASVRSTCVSVVFVLSADSYREMSKHSPVLSTQLERYFIKKLTKSIVQTNKLITSFA
jgi:CRP-like cAMP-binding protein